MRKLIIYEVIFLLIFVITRRTLVFFFYSFVPLHNETTSSSSFVKSTKIKISLSICDAIEELHNNNIVHCDLKLENMIYDAKENLIYLIDFGCSCNLKNESYTYSDENMGTLGYMSSDISGQLHSCLMSCLYLYCVQHTVFL